MRYRASQQQGLSPAHSPFRVVANTGREVEWINRYLDQERVRGVADSTLRSYAHDLLHFLRWWAGANQTSKITQQALSESTFLDYIRFQLNQNPPPAAASINRRVGTAERAMRREFPEAAPLFAPGFQNWYWRRSRLGYGRPRPALTQLRVKTPKRIVMPLSVDEVARFWSSFRTSRDLAILNCEDVLLSASQIRVRGKGNKIRFLPLASDTVLLLDHYHSDVRVICATHRNLAEMVDQRQFRADLFYRLSVFPVALPPLRAAAFALFVDEQGDEFWNVVPPGSSRGAAGNPRRCSRCGSGTVKYRIQGMN